MKRIELLKQSVLAGVCIGVGGLLFLTIENKIVGSFMFALGLFSICVFKFYLFTGKVGYLIENDLSYLKNLFYIWVGNFIGTFIVAKLISFTRVYSNLYAKVSQISSLKLNDDLLSVFILSIFCGLLMFVAVDGFSNNEHIVGKYLGLFLCVSGFILAGFEHCIANMFYFSLADVLDFKTIVYLLVMTIGNSLGGIIIPFFRKNN